MISACTPQPQCGCGRGVRGLQHAAARAEGGRHLAVAVGLQDRAGPGDVEVARAQLAVDDPPRLEGDQRLRGLRAPARPCARVSRSCPRPQCARVRRGGNRAGDARARGTGRGCAAAHARSLAARAAAGASGGCRAPAPAAQRAWPPSPPAPACRRRSSPRSAPAGPVLQSVDRVLGATHPHGDLGRGQPHDEAQQDDRRWSSAASSAPSAGREALARVVAVDLGRRPDLVAGTGAAEADVVDGGVVGDAQDPAGERHLSRLVVPSAVGSARRSAG